MTMRAMMVGGVVLVLSAPSELQAQETPSYPLAIENVVVTPPAKLKTGDSFTLKFDVSSSQALQRDVLLKATFCSPEPEAKCVEALAAPALPNLGPLQAGEKKSVTTTLTMGPLVRRPSALRLVAYPRGKEVEVPAPKIFWKELDVEPSPSDLDLAVVGTPSFVGEFGPHGRLSVTTNIKAGVKLGRFTRITDATATFFWCTDKRAETCTFMAKMPYTFRLNQIDSVQTPFLRIPAQIGTGTRYLRVVVRDGSDLDDRDLANNEVYVQVETGTTRGASWGTFKNKKMPGANQATVKNIKSAAECMRQCSSYVGVCMSVDYDAKSDTCYLQNAARSSVPLSKDDKYDHYARPCQNSDSKKQCDT